jgi:hypothetical protein
MANMTRWGLGGIAAKFSDLWLVAPKLSFPQSNIYALHPLAPLILKLGSFSTQQED